MRLNINLASQPYEDGRRFWMRWGAILGAAGVVTLALVITAITSWAHARTDRVQIASLEDQIAKCDLEKSTAQEVLGRPENRATRDQSQFINGLIRRKTFSWTQVFSDLEHMMPPELRVTSIHPEMAKDSNQLEIKLNVAGKSRDRALQLIHRMEQSPRFSQPQIKSEQGQQGQPNGDLVNFEIASGYLPDKDLPPGGADSKPGSPHSKNGPKSTGSKNTNPAAMKSRISPPPQRPAARKAN